MIFLDYFFLSRKKTVQFFSYKFYPDVPLLQKLLFLKFKGNFYIPKQSLFEQNRLFLAFLKFEKL